MRQVPKKDKRENRETYVCSLMSICALLHVKTRLLHIRIRIRSGVFLSTPTEKEKRQGAASGEDLDRHGNNVDDEDFDHDKENDTDEDEDKGSDEVEDEVEEKK